MEELLEKHQKLDPAHQQELLAFANKLLLEEKLSQSKGNLSEYKKRILEVSVWSEEDVKQIEGYFKKYGQWKAPEW